MTFENALENAKKVHRTNNQIVATYHVMQMYNYKIARDEKDALDMFGCPLAEAKAIWEKANSLVKFVPGIGPVAREEK